MGQAVNPFLWCAAPTNPYFYYYYYYYYHKAASRKTRLDIQTYGCNGNLLCYHGVVERNRIYSLQSHGKALEKECCLTGIFCDSGDSYYYYELNRNVLRADLKVYYSNISQRVRQLISGPRRSDGERMLSEVGD